jgi:phage shock protein A
MTLLQRMTRLLKADVHGLLDGLEVPEEVVKQTIRDMEEALAQKEQDLAALQRRLQRLQAEAQEIRRAGQGIDQHIDLCFEADNDTLARGFLRQRLATERQARQLARSTAELQTRHEALERTIAQQRQQLTAVIQQLDHLTATQEPESPAFFSPGHGEAVISDDEVEVAFLAEKSRRIRRPSQTSA